MERRAEVEELERQLAKLQIAKKDAESAEKLAEVSHRTFGSFTSSCCPGSMVVQSDHCSWKHLNASLSRVVEEFISTESYHARWRLRLARGLTFVGLSGCKVFVLCTSMVKQACTAA